MLEVIQRVANIGHDPSALVGARRPPHCFVCPPPVKGDNTRAYRQNTTLHSTIELKASMTLYDRAENMKHNVSLEAEDNIALVSITQ